MTSRSWFGAALGLLSLASAASGQVVYQADDGGGNINRFFGFESAALLWGNAFDAQPGGEAIREVQIAFGRLPVGTPVEVLVYDDPTDDGDPIDSVLVGVGAGVSGVQNANNPDPLDTFTNYDVTAVDGSGPVVVAGEFFVAAYLADVDMVNVPVGASGRNAPIRGDGDTVTGAGWVFFGPAGAVTTGDLATFQPGLNVGDPAIFGGAAGNNLVRAVGVPIPEPAGLTLLAAAGLGLVRRRIGR
jgi:hypothetical protein